MLKLETWMPDSLKYDNEVKYLTSLLSTIYLEFNLLNYKSYFNIIDILISSINNVDILIIDHI